MKPLNLTSCYPEYLCMHVLQNSSGLLTCSLERDLLDTEPMKSLSKKRPLVCSEIWGQKVLLKVMLALAFS